MAAIDFPANPGMGQEFTAAAITYVWNGQGWTTGTGPELELPDAPADGNVYGRKNNAWTNLNLFEGTVTFRGPANQIVVQRAAAGQPCDIAFYSQSAGQMRWLLRVDGVAESGGNAGSDLYLYRYDDAGNYLGPGMSIARASGNVWFPAAVFVNGNQQVFTVNGGALTGYLTIAMANPQLYLQRTAAGQSNNIYGLTHLGTNQWLMQLGEGSQGSFMLYGYDDAGVAFYGLTLNRYTRILYTSCSIETPAGIQGRVVRATEHLLIGPSGVNNRFEESGWIVVSTGGQKPGGGPWTATASDARVKNVQGDYLHGLAEIMQLTPRVYTYKGNDGVIITDKETREELLAKPHEKVAADGTEFIGLIAQECETVMPEMVTQKPGIINGAPVEDMRALDPNALTYALINAVKELANRVAQLEAARQQR